MDRIEKLEKEVERLNNIITSLAQFASDNGKEIDLINTDLKTIYNRVQSNNINY